MENKGSATAHGKVILIGEHSVVYDKTAIVMPLKNLVTKVDLLLKRDQSQQQINSDFFIGPLSDFVDNFAGFHQLIIALLAHFNYNQGFSLTIDTKIPTSRGLGSSAALAVAITRAFFNTFQETLDQTTLIKYAKISENFAHGTASSVDIIGVSSEQIAYLNQDQVSQIKSLSQFFLVIIDSKINGSTKVAVSKVSQHTDKEFLINQLTGITKLFAEKLQTSDVKQLGELMNQSQTILKQLGVSHPSIDKIVQTALDHQALGAKLSGSGLGGIVIAITDQLEVAKNLQTTFLQAGFTDVLIQEGL